MATAPGIGFVKRGGSLPQLRAPRGYHCPCGRKEFAVIFPELAISGRLEAAKWKRKTIALRIIQTREGPFSEMASFGIAMASPGQCDFSKAPATADEALHTT
jgi:hypothetical protein